jgi:DNA-binding MarR family transcriptional regulator
MTHHDDLADAFLTASRALVGIAVRSVESSGAGVTVLQHRLLVILAAHGEQTISQIAETLGINQSNASRHCDRLQRLDLVVRRRAEHDGRVVQVRLTPTGKEVIEQVTSCRISEINAVLDSMGERQAQAALRAMDAFGSAAHELADRDWSW